MRTITTHHTNECNKALTVHAEDRNENGVTQAYHVAWPIHGETANRHITIPFQYGPIKEVGTNGATLELLLAIAIDQLDGYQSSKFANRYNKQALSHCMQALGALEARTKERTERGVEGTHLV
jgi:hypothetical protein